MARAVIGWTFVIFCGLVFINYLFTLSGNFFSANNRFFWTGGAGDANELKAIDFSFFDKGGVGRNYITQGYGRTSFSYAYVGAWHNGVDIAAVYGAPIYSPGEGIVIAAGNQDDYCPRRGFGKFVAVEDGGNHLVLWYAHLGAINVSVGETVKKGLLIGAVGASGFETGTHLHLSIFQENGFTMVPKNGCGPDAVGRDMNPLSYLGTTYQ